MWWTLFVLLAFNGESVEVLVHGSDLSYLSLVKSIVVSLSQEGVIESVVTIVKIVKDVVESLNRGSLIEVFQAFLVEAVHTDNLLIPVSELSNVIFRNKGGAIGAVNENVVSHEASK